MGIAVRPIVLNDRVYCESDRIGSVTRITDTSPAEGLPSFAIGGDAISARRGVDYARDAFFLERDSGALGQGGPNRTALGARDWLAHSPAYPG